MSKETLEIHEEKHGDVLLLRVSGPVDSATVNQFKSTLTPVFKTKGARIVIDAGDLSYMNSNAIGLLMMFRRQLYINGGRLALAGVSARITKTLETMKANNLKMYDTVNEALAALS
ncbi:MAG: anti-sigma factor antagonist [Spartobacteria bacterium]|nr:anti-sigma factor antagonist [Spartobacteria bacterium]